MGDLSFLTTIAERYGLDFAQITGASLVTMVLVNAIKSGVPWFSGGRIWIATAVVSSALAVAAWQPEWMKVAIGSTLVGLSSAGIWSTIKWTANKVGQPSTSRGIGINGKDEAAK